MKNAELAHLWAAQNQSSGKASNMFFEGDTIYSYGRHFPIAKIYEKESFILFTSEGFRSTTACHKSRVLNSINHRNIITCPDVIVKGKLSHENNVDYIYSCIEQDFKKGNKALKMKIHSYRKVSTNITNIKLYMIAFKCKSLLTKKQKNRIEEINSKLDDLMEKAEILLSEKEEAEKIRVEKKGKELMENWLNYKYNGTIYGSSPLLRLSPYPGGQTIETTFGAYVPVKEGRILYKMIKAGKDVKGYKIGDYTVISINGTLKIGCHEFEREEIERFAKLMSW